MLLVAACAPALLACARPAPPPPGEAEPSGAAAVGDTLRGTLAVVGSEPATRVVLQPISGGPPVELEGERGLARLSALEVVVWGKRVGAPGPFRVARFAVRASAGVPAVDGTLAAEGGRWFLVTVEGRRLAVPHLPEPLRGRVGARVWLAGPLDRAPDSFGVIAPAP